MYSAIMSINVEDIFIESSIFLNNTGSNEGGVLSFENINDISYKTLIISSNFTNNNAIKNGGAMKFLNQYTQITNCSFINNSAIYGGAIFFGTNVNSSCYLLLNQVVFQGNSAFQEGGAIKSTYNLPQIINNSVVMRNNKALYGNNYASYPIRIQFKICNTQEISSSLLFLYFCYFLT